MLVRRLVACCSVVLVLALAYPAYAAEKLKVASSLRGFWDTTMVQFGNERGFFAEEGLELEILWTDGGSDILQVVNSGSVDVGIGTGVMGALGAYARGAPFSIIANEFAIEARGSTKAAPATAALLVSIPLPRRRLNHLAVSSGLLNEAQITGIKDRLGLSTAQAEYWPAVEDALRDVARRHLQFRGTRQHAPRIEASSPEVKRLIGASVPLIRQLREDQKREVRELVRMIGLGTVASHI